MNTFSDYKKLGSNLLSKSSASFIHGEKKAFISLLRALQNILNKYFDPAFFSIEIIHESQGLNKVTKATRSCHFFRNTQNFKDISELLHLIPFTFNI